VEKNREGGNSVHGRMKEEHLSNNRRRKKPRREGTQEKDETVEEGGLAWKKKTGERRILFSAQGCPERGNEGEKKT